MDQHSELRQRRGNETRRPQYEQVSLREEESEDEDQPLIIKPQRNIKTETQEFSFLDSFVEMLQSFFSFLWASPAPLKLDDHTR